jgi:hypothetical protein
MIDRIVVERVGHAFIIRAYDVQNTHIKSFNFYQPPTRMNAIFASKRHCGMETTDQVTVELPDDDGREAEVGW